MQDFLLLLALSVPSAYVGAITSERVLSSYSALVRRVMLGWGGALGTLWLILAVEASGAPLWLIAVALWVGSYLPLTIDAYMQRPRTW